jgi:hypothetical protein
MVLSLAMPDEPVLRKCWRDWMLDHLAKGDELDNSHTGTLVRYAADGIWLSELTEGRTMALAPAVAGQRSDEDDALRSICTKHARGRRLRVWEHDNYVTKVSERSQRTSNVKYRMRPRCAITSMAVSFMMRMGTLTVTGKR